MRARSARHGANRFGTAMAQRTDSDAPLECT